VCFNGEESAYNKLSPNVEIKTHLHSKKTKEWHCVISYDYCGKEWEFIFQQNGFHVQQDIKDWFSWRFHDRSPSARKLESLRSPK
jgi:hypothetical protein